MIFRGTHPQRPKLFYFIHFHNTTGHQTNNDDEHMFHCVSSKEDDLYLFVPQYALSLLFQDLLHYGHLRFLGMFYLEEKFDDLGLESSCLDGRWMLKCNGFQRVMT